MSAESDLHLSVACLDKMLSRRRYLLASGLDCSEVTQAIEACIAEIRALDGQVASQETRWLQ